MKTTPKVRIKGHCSTWNVKPLGEIVTIKDSARIPNCEWTSEGVPYIRASDVSAEDISGVLFISSQSYQKYRATTGAPSKGDVLFNGGGDIGKAYYVDTSSPFYAQGGAVLYAKTSENADIDGYFIKTCFETPAVQKYISVVSAGGTMKHFTLAPAKLLPISYPRCSEQMVISALFQRLDKLIVLHQRKLDTLISVRKSLLQKMFPRNGSKVPEIRFKGFEGDWEEKRFGDLYQRVNERNDGSFGKDKWISVAKMYYQDPDKVTSNNIDTRTYVMRVGDIAFEGHSNAEYRYGRFVENDIGAGVISELFPIYRPIVEYDLMYWKYAIQLEHIMGRIIASCITSSGTSSNKLVESDLVERTLLVPHIDEQKQIGQFFSQIDKELALQRQKLEMLKNYKKSLLARMFV